MDVGDVRGINGDSLLHICYLAARDFGVIVNQVLQKVILVNYIAKPAAIRSIFTLIAAICFTVKTYCRARPHLTICKLRHFLNRRSHSVCPSFP